MPLFKRKNTHYIKIQHLRFEKYNKRNKLFDTIVILSGREMGRWQRYHSNIKIIPNFLPTIPQVATNHSQKVVLSVGRMSSEKGFLRLLDIWKMVQTKIMDCHESLRASRNDNMANDLREWKLIIVGDGVLKSEIESKIHALNLGESVLLKPFTKDIEREYLSASIYAMASHFEGFPMVLLESTAYGLAPISFDIATWPSDIIENNKSGFLIADNDLQGYADKLIALMRDESMRKRFGSETKRIVSERFSKEAIIKLWKKLLVDRWIINTKLEKFWFYV